jgi:hypothetical protein
MNLAGGRTIRIRNSHFWLNDVVAFIAGRTLAGT